MGDFLQTDIKQLLLETFKYNFQEVHSVKIAQTKDGLNLGGQQTGPASLLTRAGL